MDGRALAARVRAEVAEDVRGLGSITLATVLVGDDPASELYIASKHRAAEEVGIRPLDHRLPADTSEEKVVELVSELSRDDDVDGILPQLPLPPAIRLRAVVDAIDPAKDIDGIHPMNAGLLRLGYDGFLPATAHAAVEILRRSGIEIEGKRACVIGRSAVVGMPAAFLLLRENATVTVCHSRTRDLAHHVREAEIVVVAAGHPGLVTGAMLQPGVVIVDVGINVVDDTIVGDVEFESARTVASAITPVPGGVGPLTNALLLAHLARAAQAQLAMPSSASPNPVAT